MPRCERMESSETKNMSIYEFINYSSLAIQRGNATSILGTRIAQVFKFTVHLDIILNLDVKVRLSRTQPF